MTTLRRGLPRTRGGEPWPPAVEISGDASVAPSSVPELVEGASLRSEPMADPAPVLAPGASLPTSPSETRGPGSATGHVTARGSALRRGLPRLAGGEPWPPAGAAPGASSPTAMPIPVPELAEGRRLQPEQPPAAAPAVVAGAATGSATEGVPAPAAESALRRGLPRVSGGEPWPPAGVASRSTVPEFVEGTSPRAEAEAAVVLPSAAADAATGSPATAVARRPDVSAPLPFTRTVWNGSAPRHVAAEPAPSKLRPTWPQALGGLFAAAGLAVLAGAAIAIVRAFLSLPFMQDFLAAYPGEYHLPAGAPVGLPGWVGWQHFFNVFLMTLIIRSGLRVRTEKRPTAFWTPRGNPKGKISLTLWFHQALDLLWILNGAIFIVLLFVTGQWMRLVPTSWEVFPNALSAALQYVSFDWPTENGWVNYNSLQQLAYFSVVFLAAPVAIATGFRMSGLWPKKAAGLSKAYPIELARAVHFPTMLFFVAFIVVHVALVLLTGMLRNLNHMFAAQDAVTWTGFWVFLLSLAVIAGGWVAARPLVLAPIAKLFGQVSGR
ncbi:cytochrome b/b6 domain-containing protein [Microbacterium xylanilyticum]